MPFEVTVTWGVRPGSIWDVLAKRLGREPTNAEATAEVKRLLSENTVKLAGEGKLSWQR
jgi:hypothetical protein